MSANEQSVLVCGATGRQGFAVCRQLLQSGRPVLAMTRSPHSDKASELAALGAQVVLGDLDDRTSLDEAVHGVFSVFSVQDFWEAGYDREIEQGKRIIDAAAHAGVTHFIYTSVGGTDRCEGRGIHHFDTKRVIEAHLVQSGLQHTIFRPVTFFENFVSSNAIASMLDQGVFEFPYDPHKPFQMVALDDLGVAVVKALDHPDQFSGVALELASQTLSMEDFVAALTSGIGREVVFRELPYEEFAARMNAITTPELAAQHKSGPSFLAQYHWHRETNPETGGWAADLALIDSMGLQRTSAQDWAKSVDWSLLS